MVSVIVNVDVPDLGEAVKFYEDGLGFAGTRRLFGGTVAELTAEATKIYLIQRDPGSVAVPDATISRTYAPHWTPVHLDVVVDDIETALAKALGAGATSSGDITTNDWGKLAPIRDPFGHGICLIQFQGGGYDHVEG